MRIVFVAIGAEQLGIGLLSSILRRAGHDTRLVFNPALFDDRYNLDVPYLKELFRRDQRIVNEIISHAPDVIAFSPLTVTYRWTLGIARAIKNSLPNSKIILGGVHTSAVPEVVFSEPFVDAIAVGEADHALLAYVNALGSNFPINNIDNLWVKFPNGRVAKGANSSFLQELDDLPFSDKELFEDVLDLGANYLVMGSRGCPYRCTFCFNNFWAKLPDAAKNGSPGKAGKFVRHRSPEHLMAELRWAKARYPIRHIEFVDDVFTVNHAWLARFLKQYKREINVPFSCLTHAKYVNDEAARLLADAGCENVQMGIQSMDENYRRNQLKRVERAHDVDRALSSLEKYGVQFSLDHIFGFPGEAAEAQGSALSLYERFKPRRVNTFWLTFYPGTEIFHEAISDGRVTAKEAKAIEHGEAPSYHQPQGSDANSIKRYLRYELLFKAIPLFGKKLGKILPESIVLKVPKPILRVAITAADVASAVKTRNQDFAIYLRYYVKEMARALLPTTKGNLRIPSKENPSLRELFQSFGFPKEHAANDGA